eukprot:gb/GEZJ01000097.1/.p1 GENE.gb/GEZJ01000097.1/~~gb/GEZJ01000097.1/.p1  ORF type:complete len:258 (+),score=23.41 gb/GEZJ01000097.1/:4744-5517(+)
MEQFDDRSPRHSFSLDGADSLLYQTSRSWNSDSWDDTVVPNAQSSSTFIISSLGPETIISLRYEKASPLKQTVSVGTGRFHSSATSSTTLIEKALVFYQPLGNDSSCAFSDSSTRSVLENNREKLRKSRARNRDEYNRNARKRYRLRKSQEQGVRHPLSIHNPEILKHSALDSNECPSKSEGLYIVQTMQLFAEFTQYYHSFTSRTTGAEKGALIRIHKTSNGERRIVGSFPSNFIHNGQAMMYTFPMGTKEPTIFE